LSAFSQGKVAELAQIPVQPSRGSRQSSKPFLNDQPALLLALHRAENAYHETMHQTRILDHYTKLKSVFEEQKRFLLDYSRVLHAWKSMSDLARKDLAATADWFLAFEELGDNELLLASRSQKSPEDLIAQFDRIVAAIQRALHDNACETEYVIPSSKKKDLLNGKSLAPLREFTYQLKLHWDETMQKSKGQEFHKQFAFSIAHGIVFAAIQPLTKDYNKDEVLRIIRSLQKANYDPNEFRDRVPGGLITMLKMFRPQLVFGVARD
jgi:hypothetical protein